MMRAKSKGEMCPCRWVKPVLLDRHIGPKLPCIGCSPFVRFAVRQTPLYRCPRGAKQAFFRYNSDRGYGPFLPTLPALDCPDEVRTGTPTPSGTDSREYHHSCNGTEHSPNNASAATDHKSDKSPNEAAQYSRFHIVLPATRALAKVACAQRQPRSPSSIP